MNNFWLKTAHNNISWVVKPSHTSTVSFVKPVSIKWFEDGILNVTVSCIDRNVQKNPEKAAFFWESDSGDVQKIITYQELSDEVGRFANVLRKLYVKKGDRVIIYLPMIPQAVYAMLACARIGAVHSVVFAGFSANALHNRIVDCDAKIVITADGGRRAGKIIPLKSIVDQAVINTNVKNVIVIPHITQSVGDLGALDHDYISLRYGVSPICPPQDMNAEDPLFILYTSGSTGTPKGVLHTCGGYLVYVNYSFKKVFSPQDNDIYWCTADVGWITGHSYIVYGPLSVGISQVLFEGVPTYPSPDRCWKIIDKYNVSIFYTAPTAIRTLMRAGDDFLRSSSRASLRLLGSVGEPIDPDAWRWLHDKIGGGRCQLMDTWWQTETGGIMIAPNKVGNQKPGFAGKPLPLITPVLLDHAGGISDVEGNLCLSQSWPGQARTLYGDHERFEKSYFSDFIGYYFSGDGAKRDADGDYRITGRVDDVINVSGHRLSTAEIEATIDDMHDVVETAVVGCPHDLKGQGIYVFATLKHGVLPSEDLKMSIISQVRAGIGPIATPDYIQFCDGLPKTRSGKIMRRILRKIVAGGAYDLGDISTLANPEVVEEIRKNYANFM